MRLKMEYNGLSPDDMLRTAKQSNPIVLLASYQVTIITEPYL